MSSVCWGNISLSFCLISVLASIANALMTWGLRDFDIGERRDGEAPGLNKNWKRQKC